MPFGVSRYPVRSDRFTGLKRVLSGRGARITLVGMTAISLKLPEGLPVRPEKENRARRTAKSSLVRHYLQKRLPVRTSPLRDLPKLWPGHPFYYKALPILKKAWMRRGRGLRDLATNHKCTEVLGV